MYTLDSSVSMVQCADPTLVVTVTPSAYSGIDVSPSNTFTLTCRANKPSIVSPPIELNWYYDDVLLDSSRPGTSIVELETEGGAEKSSMLTITDAHTVNSGRYTCVAVIDVPESNRITSNQSATVTIQGMCSAQLTHSIAAFGGSLTMYT